ncbi:MAG: hypothetical protein ACOCVU_05975 [Desulfohalobiaceae bacterium]
MDDLKEMIRRARREASIQKQEMVIGQDGDHWFFVSKDDPESDMVRPGIIVDASGIRYPEHHAMVEKILLGGTEDQNKGE